MSGSIRVGTSGWNYDHWRGRFYPKGLSSQEWFGHYCQQFDTVEINNTFYHQPQDSTFDAWRKQAPRGFRYAVKANRYITHMKKLNDPAEPLARFFAGTFRLKEHLGPLLYQLPPHWNKNLPRLDQFLKQLPQQRLHVMEFRERDWLDEDTYELLHEYGVGLCVHDMLPRHPRRVTGKIVYVRFHGAGSTYGGKYRPSRLQKWAEWIEEAAHDRDAYVYFNNDESAYAVRNALELKEMLGA